MTPVETMTAKKKVLVVDDEEDVASTVSDVLLQIEGVEVDYTSDPCEAYKFTQSKEYDLLIFDFHLPMLNGDSLFQCIEREVNNSHGTRKHPRLLLMSGMLTEEMLDSKIKSVGGTSFLHKPFSSEAILSRVKSLLSDPC